MLGPVLLNIFINDVNKGIEWFLSQLAEDTKLGVSIKLLDGKKSLQRDLTGWIASLRFNKENGQVLHWGHNNSMQCYRLSKECLQICLLGNYLRKMLFKP